MKQLMDCTAKLNKSGIDTEKWPKRWNIPNCYGKGFWFRKARGWHSAPFEIFVWQLAPTDRFQKCCPQHQQLNRWTVMRTSLHKKLCLLWESTFQSAFWLLLFSSAHVRETNHKANTSNELHINMISTMFNLSVKVRAALCGWVPWAKYVYLWVISEEQNCFQLVLARVS